VTLFREKCRDYKTANLSAPADTRLNLESIEIADEQIGTVIANHVLEHVDDHKALRELFRILKPGGFLIVSTPIVEGWEHTYENADVLTAKDREIHFGQSDHVRYYGRDFRVRVHRAGFKTRHEITAEGPDIIKYGLGRGGKIFVFEK